MSVYVGVPKTETAIEITSVLTGTGELGALDVTGATLNGTPIVPANDLRILFSTEGSVIKVNINVTTDITELSFRLGWIDGGVNDLPFDPASLSFTVYSQNDSVYDIMGANTTKTTLTVPLNEPFPVGAYTIEIALSSDVPYFFGLLDDLSIQAQYGIEGNGVAHKVKKIYTGVDNVARKVKKGYVGVGGVARPFFSAEAELEYYGTIDPLANARHGLATTTVGNYAIFAGGVMSNGVTDAMDYYTDSLVKGTGDLRDAKSNLAATTVGGYAIFAGGRVYPDTSGWYTSYSVDTYDSSLTRRTGTVLAQRRGYLAATTVGNYAIFAGGSTVDTVDAYDISLVRTTPTALSEARGYLSATTVGDYALFGGGNGELSSQYTDTVDAYASVLTRSTPSVLSVARDALSATTVGDHALFGGGRGSSPYNKFNVDAYDTSLTRTTPSTLNAARYNLSATTVGNYALFGGGRQSPNRNLNTVDVYDKSLTKSMASNLSNMREMLAATTVGDYALFGGGYGTSPAFKDTVDAYYQEDAQYVTLTFEFTNKDFGLLSGFPEGSDIYLCYAEDPSAVGAIDNKFSRVTDTMLEDQPPLTVRVKKGKILCLGFRISESDSGRLAYLKTDIIPWTEGSGGFLAYWNQTFFSLNPKYPYNEFYCSASVVHSIIPPDPVIPGEGEDWYP